MKGGVRELKSPKISEMFKGLYAAIKPMMAFFSTSLEILKYK